MLKELLEQNKKTILELWTEEVLKTYSSRMAKFMNEQPNQFANPVGHILKCELEKIYDGMVEGHDISALADPVENILKIRAVQEFSPSNAVSFIVSLKDIGLRQLEDKASPSDLKDLDKSVDKLLLLAFDVYTKCREKIFEIRIKEIKSSNKINSFYSEEQK